mgnify:FL=1
MKEVENSLCKDVLEKVKNNHGNRALWISKRWWRYRPKLPYMYFLQKLDSSEVMILVVHPSVSVFILPFRKLANLSSRISALMRERTCKVHRHEKILGKKNDADGAM